MSSSESSALFRAAVGEGGYQQGLLSSVLRWTGWEEGGEYVGVGEDAWKGLIEGE